MKDRFLKYKPQNQHLRCNIKGEEVMPTGYTSEIEKGISFEKFVMRCARAFGALIMMRDESMDAKIPIFKPSTYCRTALTSVKKRLKNIRNKKVGEMLDLSAKEAAKDFKQEKVYHEETIQKYRKLEKQYRKMLDKVFQWQPPTADHEGLKKFMIEQIEDSIRGDCSTEHMREPELLTPEKHFGKKLEKIAWDFAYYQKGWAEELERTRGRNKWVKDLVKSLGITPQKAGLAVTKTKKTKAKNAAAPKKAKAVSKKCVPKKSVKKK